MLDSVAPATATAVALVYEITCGVTPPCETGYCVVLFACAQIVENSAACWCTVYWYCYCLVAWSVEITEGTPGYPLVLYAPAVPRLFQRQPLAVSKSVSCVWRLNVGNEVVASYVRVRVSRPVRTAAYDAEGESCRVLCPILCFKVRGRFAVVVAQR